MSLCIGIRHEDKYNMEKRAPLTPSHVAKLIKEQQLDITVESSTRRIFKDEEYKKVGAKVSDNLDHCDVILGVKEMPESYFKEGKTYVFFSHVIKGQEYNMPMLRRIMELKCNLIDYERVIDDQNKRLIFFGRYAGLAGMINTLWAVGLRLKHFGYETPFLQLQQSHKYDSLEDARKAISKIGHEISEQGLPQSLSPLTIGFTGYGNVSNGAQEICGLLPVKEISPDDLLKLKERKNVPTNVIYKVIFKEEHISKPIEPGAEFDLQDYYNNPQNYTNQFEQYVPHLSILMNCMYWDERYPKIISKEFLAELFTNKKPKLIGIGDVTCDVNGSVECTVKSTPIEDPIFVYNPFTKDIEMGYEGTGILDMAVDILPSELPRDASYEFANAVMDFIKPIAYADYGKEYVELDLPMPIKRALILHNGKLTPTYEYIENFLQTPDAPNIKNIYQ